MSMVSLNMRRFPETIAIMINVFAGDRFSWIIEPELTQR
jgi:hypothetical protein